MSIKIENLNFNYADNIIFDNFNIKFKHDKITCLVGKNGVGKTTLSKIIMNILKDYTGDITFLDNKISKQDTFEVSKKIGYCFQDPNKQLFCESVIEEIKFSKKFNKNEIYDEDKILKEFNLELLKDSYPMNLSSGEKQRLVLACQLVLDREYYILDEPTANLDQNNIDNLIRILKEINKGMLIISHDDYFINKIADEILNIGDYK